MDPALYIVLACILLLGFVIGYILRDVEVAWQETEGRTSVSAQAWAIQRMLNQLLIEEHVRAEDLAILIVDGLNKDTFYGVLQRIPLPLRLSWSVEDHAAKGSVLVETVSRLKGLEKAASLLWVPESCCPKAMAESLYVGTSRAKSLLQVVGSSAACTWVRTGG